VLSVPSKPHRISKPEKISVGEIDDTVYANFSEKTHTIPDTNTVRSLLIIKLTVQEMLINHRNDTLEDLGCTVAF
jgi:hypothetical protein